MLQLLATEVQSDLNLFGVAYAMAFSAKMALLDMYACTETNHRMNCVEETEMQTLALRDFQSMVTEVTEFGMALTLSDEARLTSINPLICDCFYQAAAAAAWYEKESGSKQMAQSRDALKDVLLAINNRWKLSG